MRSLLASRSESTGESPPHGTAISRGLGWFSIAVAATELAAPRQVAKALGLRPTLGTTTTIRLLGLRELATGMSILLQPRRPLPIWARVAGDVTDIGLLAIGAAGAKTSPLRASLGLAGLAGVTALDAYAAFRVTKHQDEAQAPVMFSVTINKSPAEVYAYFRKLSHLPAFMRYLESVDERADGTSHWVAKLPIGGTVAWDAEIVEERAGELLAWRTTSGAPLAHEGRVTFAKAPGRTSTEVRVAMTAAFAGSRHSRLLAKSFAKPQIKGDLRRLKQILETGEVLLSDASVHRGHHPAQPPARGPDRPPELERASSGSGRPMRTSSLTGAHDSRSAKGFVP